MHYDSFKIGVNGGKLFQWVENAVGKGDIDCYWQFLLFLQTFLNTYSADT